MRTLTGAGFTLIDEWRVTETSDERAAALAKSAEAAGRPVAMDLQARAAYLGTPASERARQLTSLVAPDFTLPDLRGRLHSLADHRGEKVFLVAYGSW
jgi:hypothetical protein